jgi:single-strand DNA-binding protein
MANLNKVLLIGRLTRDPEIRAFANGGKVASFGLAINSRRKNQKTGQWEDAPPLFLDCEAFNRGETGRTADLVAEHLQKGHQAFIEGHLKMDEWTGNDGQKRSKVKIVVDSVQFLQPREAGGGGAGADRAGGAEGHRRPAAAPAPANPIEPEPTTEASSGAEEDIPF